MLRKRIRAKEESKGVIHSPIADQLRNETSTMKSVDYLPSMRKNVDFSYTVLTFTFRMIRVSTHHVNYGIISPNFLYKYPTMYSIKA